MAENTPNFDIILNDWPFQPGQVQVRRIEAPGGREVLQMRVDMGLLQMETVGRPDGQRPHGFDTYYDYLVAQADEEGEEFQLDDERCTEVDREFYQYYHRRICWLTLRDYSSAIKDATHTLALMEFTSTNAPNPEWSLVHEQYRPFVLFHKIQASALEQLEANEPKTAVGAIDQGLTELQRIFETHEAEDFFEEDGFVIKLQEMRTAIVEQYELGPSLTEQLADAIAQEQYELAAKLRDRIAGDHGGP